MTGSRFSWQLASPLHQQVSDVAGKKLRSRIYLGNELWRRDTLTAQFLTTPKETKGQCPAFSLLMMVILMILHWKIAFTSLKYSFHSNPNIRCFVLVHFQSHNAPTSPPLHISERGHTPQVHVHFRFRFQQTNLDACKEVHAKVSW